MMSDRAKKTIAGLERDLLAYCLHRQGRTGEAIDCLDTGTRDPERLILQGWIKAESGAWEDAVELWAGLLRIKERTADQSRRASDLVLKAGPPPGRGQRPRPGPALYVPGRRSLAGEPPPGPCTR